MNLPQYNLNFLNGISKKAVFLRITCIIVFLISIIYIYSGSGFYPVVSILMPESENIAGLPSRKIQPATEFKIIKSNQTIERALHKIFNVKSTKEIKIQNNEIIEKIKSGLDYKFDNETRIFELYYKDRSKEYSMKILNAVSEAYTENYVSNIHSYSGNTLQNLYQMQRTYSKELTELNARYEKFCNSEKIVNIDNELSVLSSQFSQYNNELSKIQAEINLTEKLMSENPSAKTEVKVETGPEFKPDTEEKNITEPVTIEGDEFSRELKKKIRDSEMRLAMLKRKYTEAHPLVKNELANLDIFKTKLQQLNSAPIITETKILKSKQAVFQAAPKNLKPSLKKNMTAANYNLEVLKIKKDTYVQLIQKCEEAIRQYPRKKSMVRSYEVEIENFENLISKITKQIEETKLYQNKAVENAPTVIEYCKSASFNMPGYAMMSCGFSLLVFMLSFAIVDRAKIIEEKKKIADIKTVLSDEMNFKILGHLIKSETAKFNDPAFSDKCFSYHRRDSKNSRSVNVIRNGIINQIEKDACNIVAITSLNSGEGKTTLAVNLALSFAISGALTLITDINYKTSGGNYSAADLCKTDKSFGLTDIVIGEAELEEVSAKTAIENLSIVSTGALPPSVLKVIESPICENFISQVTQRFEFTVADGPSFNISSDFHAVSKLIKNIVMIVDTDRNRDIDDFREEINAFNEFIKHNNLKLLGVVINEKQ